jgi:hypothetical protein
MDSSRNEEQKGQSIILVAFLFLALVILAAIAVDVTSAYSDRRVAQNAADAAALAAAQELGHHLRGEYVTNDDVLFQLNDFAQRNGASRVTGNYLDENRAPLAEIVAGGSIPEDALGVEATAHITAPTFFGGVVGFDGYPLSAEAGVEFESVCYGGECLLPIAVFAGGFKSGSAYDWVVDFEDGQCYNLWDGKGGGNFGWLNWSNQGDDFSCKSAGSSADCSATCVERNMNPDTCIDQPADMVWVGDEVGGGPGIMNASQIRAWLDYYIDTPGLIARLLLYDETEEYGGATCGTATWNNGQLKKRQGTFYIVEGFGAFKITGYRLSQGKGKAVMRDEIPPETCVDYPSEDGLCCYYWEECEDGSCDYECAEWVECDYNTGDVNRITGVFQAWTEDTYETCEASGNFLAPRLFK